MSYSEEIVKMVCDDTRHLGLELRYMEAHRNSTTSLSCIAADAVTILSGKGFDFSSPRGQDFLLAFKKRFLNPTRYSWTQKDVEDLKKLFKEQFEIDIYTFAPAPREVFTAKEAKSEKAME